MQLECELFLFSNLFSIKRACFFLFKSNIQCAKVSKLRKKSVVHLLQSTFIFFETNPVKEIAGHCIQAQIIACIFFFVTFQMLFLWFLCKFDPFWWISMLLSHLNKFILFYCFFFSSYAHVHSLRICLFFNAKNCSIIFTWLSHWKRGHLG